MYGPALECVEVAGHFILHYAVEVACYVQFPRCTRGVCHDGFCPPPADNFGFTAGFITEVVCYAGCGSFSVCRRDNAEAAFVCILLHYNAIDSFRNGLHFLCIARIEYIITKLSGKKAREHPHELLCAVAVQMVPVIKIAVFKFCSHPAVNAVFVPIDKADCKKCQNDCND